MSIAAEIKVIHIFKSPKFEGQYYAKKGAFSELALKHINGGCREIYNESHLSDMIDLAKSHGWQIYINEGS